MTSPDAQARARFTSHLLEDLEVLEELLGQDKIESGVSRIGAEQEMFLVDSGFSPSPIASRVLKAAADPRLTSELARFNLEANLTPLVFHGSCLRDLERELREVVALVDREAETFGGRVLLAGILPTLHKSDASLANMSEAPRYAQLNEAMLRERGGTFQIHIVGLDELQITHENVMLESCNTSFQLHYQVDPENFARCYNIAQAITAPVLAVGANSPLFLRARLWEETRIPLFERSIDNRSAAHQARGGRPRVLFGDSWVDSSVLEIFREDIRRFPVLLPRDPGESSRALMGRGEMPPLRALCMFNGTVYRWNRPCFGISDGVPHLRIENRVLPAGPTVLDEVANAAFFYGLLHFMHRDGIAVDDFMSFDAAKQNFVAAARYGLGSQLTWLDGRSRSASDLVLEDLLPLARRGLEGAEIDSGDAERCLGVIEERVRRRRTGARWVLDSIAAAPTSLTADVRDRQIAAAMWKGQQGGDPVHAWPLVSPTDEPSELHGSLRTVGQVMTTDLVTVRPGEVVPLAAAIMNWERVRHVPVEDQEGRLIGLISYWSLLEMVAKDQSAADEPVLVDSIMRRDPITVGPDTPTVEAMEIMEQRAVSCLPVVHENRLVGILTERDLIRVSRRLLKDYLREP